MSLNPDKNAVGNARYFGYCMDLITEIATILNITFEFMITEKSEFPNLQKDLTERVSSCEQIVQNALLFKCVITLISNTLYTNQ